MLLILQLLQKMHYQS